MPLTRLGSLLLLLAWLCLGAGHYPGRDRGQVQTRRRSGGGQAQVVSDILAAKEDPAVTIRLIETRIKELEGASDADTAKRLTEIYRKALSNMEVMRNQEAKSAALAQTLENAPTEIQRLRKEIEVLRAQAEDQPKAPREDIPIAELEQLLTQAGADEAALTARLGELDKSLSDWPQTLAAARQSTQDARKALDDLATEVAQPAPEGETAATKEARLLAQETRQRALRAELARLDREILSQGVREDLLRAERDKNQLELKRTQANVGLLREAMSARRLAEAEQAKRQAKAATVEASGRHALVGELAAMNADLTEKLGEATRAQGAITTELTQLRAQAKRLEEEYRNTRQRMEISGITEAMGQLLLNSRQQLPDPAEIEQANRAREHRIADASLREIRYNEDLQRLRDLDGQVEERLAALPAAEVTGELRGQVREQLERQRELLGQAQEANQAYLRLLGELDFAAQELLRTVNAYQRFLAQHLLWTRSAPPVMGMDAFTSVPRGLAWLLAPSHWQEVLKVLLYEATSSPSSGSAWRP